MLRARFHEEAEDEMYEAARYYNGKLSNLGVAVLLRSGECRKIPFDSIRNPRRVLGTVSVNEYCIDFLIRSCTRYYPT